MLGPKHIQMHTARRFGTVCFGRWIRTVRTVGTEARSLGTCARQLYPRGGRRTGLRMTVGLKPRRHDLGVLL